nr:MFS transporter [Candidatus Omnitrophota bacterium]
AVMGIHETIMRAAIADQTNIDKRGLAYGIFNTVYGLAFLISSFLTGFLYDKAPVFIPVFVVVAQFFSLVVFFYLNRLLDRERKMEEKGA